MPTLKKTTYLGPFKYRWRRSTNLGWNTGEWNLAGNTIDMYTNNHFPLNTSGDDGGAWYMFKTTEELFGGNVNNSLYQGQFTIGGEYGTWSKIDMPSGPSDDELSITGTSMMSKCLPTSSSADVAVTGAELIREGVPSLFGLQTMKHRTQLAKAAGSEYLNYEFGWKPLVSEVNNLAKAVKQSEHVWSQYRKGSGKKTRVGYHGDESTGTSTYNDWFIPNPSRVQGFITNGTGVQVSKSESWFNGAFKYYVPEPVDLPSKFSYWSSEASKLYGIRMTPEVLWNLAPWSWAVDWYTNAGDVFANISALGTDGLALQYGYAMSMQSIETSRTGICMGVSVGRRSIMKRCKRIRANPYGFGAAFSTLTGRQAAVLAALGITRT
jgi:hypothetical protein